MKMYFAVFLAFLAAITKAHGAPDDLWQVSVGYAHDRDRLSFRAEPVISSNWAQSAFPGYLDGFVLEDDSGNIGGRTGNWGFNDQTQVTDRPGYVRYREVVGSELTSSGQAQVRSFSRHGLTAGVRRFLGEERKWAVGLDFYYSRNRVAFQQDLVFQLQERFADHPLEGVTPPTAPYAGRFVQTPGVPRLVFEPERSPTFLVPGPVQSSQAMVRYRVLDGALSVSRQIWRNERWRFSGRAGLGIEYGRVRMVLDQETVYEGQVMQTERGVRLSDSRADLYGLLGLDAQYSFGEEGDWAVVVSGDYRWWRESRVILKSLYHEKRPVRLQVALRREF